ncbi:acyltransferase family protein [Geodermatophilus sabuli]|uniref:Acyltransferase family protein n=1 Tax=Geodermatophilus sabuli TaxID=1564158 RepID=A0A7K3VXH6_9ACTN|nr:acyltransferase family protein [Geodermatophilus sabuli]
MTGPREPAVDAVRALAVGGVVLGHWLVTAPVLVDGAVRADSPLRGVPGLAPASWLLQTLGLFFLAAGFAAARSGGGWWPRVRRLLSAVTTLVAVVGVAAAALAWTGAPQGVVRTAVLLPLRPLWFLAVYLVLLAATPALLRLDRRWGARAAAVPVLLTLLLPLAGPVPVAVAAPLAWWTPWQLGVAMARRPLPPRASWALLLGGVLAVALLVGPGGLPDTAVGVPGARASNLDPPSAATLALALAQTGAVGIALPGLRRLGRTRAVAAVDRAALPVFLAHQPLLVALWLGTLPLAPVPGLHDAPAGWGWLLHRAGWAALCAGVLVATLAATRRTAPHR